MNWYYAEIKQGLGQVSEQELAQMRECSVDVDAQIRAEAGKEWTRLYQIPKTGPALQSLPEAPATGQNPPPLQLGSQASPQLESQKNVANLKHFESQGIGKQQAATMLEDLRSMDFEAEFTPVASNLLVLIKKDFVFWAVSLLANLPLVLITLDNSQFQLTGFLLFFATIWSFIFKKFIINESPS